eukprot:1300656-Rhodomonas_salina.1
MPGVISANSVLSWRARAQFRTRTWAWPGQIGTRIRTSRAQFRSIRTLTQVEAKSVPASLALRCTIKHNKPHSWYKTVLATWVMVFDFAVR